MKSSTIALVTCCLCALAYAATTASAASTCRFEVLVKTGDRKNAGTDARISLEVSGARGPTLRIRSLKAWGGEKSRNYFERGNLDVFRGTGPCLTVTPCRMQLASSGTGSKPGWYVSYVQVKQIGLSSLKRRWDIEQWLAAPPRQLSVVRYDCSYPPK